MPALALWRILIVCGCGLVFSWIPAVYRIRRSADDTFGMDLAICLGAFCLAIIIGLSSAAVRHVESPTTVPVMGLFSVGIFYGVRARVRWYLKHEKGEA